MSEPKFCVNCKWFIPSPEYGRHPTCAHEKSQTSHTDLVMGTTNSWPMECRIMRQSSYACFDARLFEEANPSASSTAPAETPAPV